MIRVRQHALLFALVFAAVFAVRSTGRRASASDALRPDFNSSQLVAVLLVSAECVASDPEIVSVAFQRLVEQLRLDATKHGERVHTVGVAIDADPRIGIATLKAFGSFGELAVGGGWMNTSALHYAVRDIAGEAMVPQVVLLRRQRGNGSLLSVPADSLLVRLRGVEAIHRWVERRHSSVTLPEDLTTRGGSGEGK